MYEIWDKKEGEVYKYGISDKPIEEDGLSGRVRDQVYHMNLTENWVRYFGRVLVRDISNRILAKQMEKACIEACIKEHGRRPRGNPLRRKSKFDQPLPEVETDP